MSDTSSSHSGTGDDFSFYSSYITCRLEDVETKYTFENVQETTTGFLMKKEGNILWIRIN